MKIRFEALFFIICFFAFTGTLQAKVDKPTLQEIQSFIFREQNRPNFSIGNPLKGFSVFNFFPMYPVHNKVQFEKINGLLKKELEKIGIVKKLELEVKSKDGVEGIDLTPFDIWSSLTYEIKNLITIDGKDTGFVRASLSFESRVSISKTKQECSPYLWTSNCFLKGNTEKYLEKLVEQSLAYLMSDFSESYHLVNSSKPVFNVCAP